MGIVKHLVSWNKEVSLESIRENINSVVDVKLAQFLSNFEVIIGKDLADEFRTLTHDAPSHSFEYSQSVVKEDFGEKYDLEGSTLIGSGSIAQIHKLVGTENIVIKVVHPHSEEEIKLAINTYRKFRNNWFIPAKLKVICDVFFDGLESQVDMRNEAMNTTHFPSTNLYVCPKALQASKRCLVMLYEPSVHLNTATVSDHVRYDTYHAIITFCNHCIERGWIHADLHEGNFGIRCKNDQFDSIVVYDFGFVHNVTSDISETIRKDMSHWGQLYEFEGYKNALIKVLGIDTYDTENMDLTPALEPFAQNMECLILYYFTMCDITPTAFKLMSTMEKYYPYIKELIELERK